MENTNIILANELRIGNYLYRKVYNPIPNKEDYYFDKVKVEGILKDCVYFIINNKKQIFKSNNLKPIPLTEQRLIEFGFEFNCYSGDDKLLNFNNFQININGYDNSIISYNGNRIYNVHQLQNLYFALTREELIFHNTSITCQKETKYFNTGNYTDWTPMPDEV
ncbi:MULTISPECIES: hypothetical protein [unclassified Empedobacter]|uniref:hypothetical protein n=1 Tax=unclassified Empedobacter TaxID=2643773 RepID=UPI0025C2BF64|nr:MULTISPECIES: hypothetical protein [unclassified Empedobacter]